MRLTYVEFEILAALARSPGRVFTRTMLLERVWGDAAYRDPRTIDVHIRHLREKLEQRAEGAGADPHRARGRVSLPATDEARPRLRSLRNKLALLFFAITAAAFAVIYFYVVPQLESKLRDRQLEDLAQQAAEVAAAAAERAARRRARRRASMRLVRAVADSTDARVTLFNTTRSLTGLAERRPRPALRHPHRLQRAARVPAQRRAAAQAPSAPAAPSAASARFQGEPFVQVAQPLPESSSDQLPRVALYSRDLDTVTEAVAFTRERVLLATGAALLLALIGGYLVARALARRVRRLEVAAAEVARGHFIEPLPVDSEDELGQLTRTFNEMQERLRELDVARKDFIATASHELRTPIFSLAGFVELLQDEDLDEETHREFIDIDEPSRSRGCRSCRSTCSTSRASTPARWSCTPSRST